MYWYLASRFLVLAASTGHGELIPAALPGQLESALEEIWNGADKPVSQVGWGEPKLTGYRDYLQWKRGRVRERPSGR